MTKVTPETLLPAHTRSARGLLVWQGIDLANSAGLSGPLIRKFETYGTASKKAKSAMIEALEGAGVKLLNGGKPGARLDKFKMFVISPEGTETDFGNRQFEAHMEALKLSRNGQTVTVESRKTNGDGLFHSKKYKNGKVVRGS